MSCESLDIVNTHTVNSSPALVSGGGWNGGNAARGVSGLVGGCCGVLRSIRRSCSVTRGISRCCARGVALLVGRFSG